jgi:hypothetical protein
MNNMHRFINYQCFTEIDLNEPLIMDNLMHEQGLNDLTLQSKS